MKMARHCTVSFFVTALVAGCASLAGGTEDSNPAPVPDAKAGKPLDPTDELERILHDITVVNFKHHRLETELRDVKKRLTTIEAQAFPREDRKNECSGNVPGLQRLEEEKEALKKAFDYIQLIAGRTQDDDLRRSWLENVRDNPLIMAEAEEMGFAH